MFRFESLGPETFLRGRWVGIHLYGGDKITVPVQIPKQSDLDTLKGYELAVLYVLLAMVSVGRGSSVDGWPRWAMDASADEDSMLFNAVRSRIRALAGAEVDFPHVNHGKLVFRHGVYAVDEVCNKDGSLDLRLWLRSSLSAHS